MHAFPARSIALVLVLSLIASGCSPAPAPTESEPPPAVATDVPLSTPSPEVAIPTVVPTEAPGVLIPPDTNVLALLAGEARLSRDNGASWTATGTGQFLAAGDEIQISDGGTALVFLLNGGAVRLEGPSDFQIVRAERNAASAATQIILKLWDGYGLFETNPLPTPDSLFQFHVMTTFVGLEYDPQAAAAVDPAVGLDPERSVIAGGLLSEDTERLYHFRGPASLYLLDQLEGVTFAAELPAAPDEYADMEASFLDDYELEAELEGFGITAGYLIAECKLRGSCEGVDISGNTISHVAELQAGVTLYFFGGARAGVPQLPAAVLTMLAEGIEQSAVQSEQAAASGSVSIRRAVAGRMTWRQIVGQPANSRRPWLYAPDTQLLRDEAAAFGCDPASGSGCPPPDGCDPASGSGCDLPGGCNVITHANCTDHYVGPPYVPTGDGMGGYRLNMPGALDPGCDPNTPGGCSGAYDPADWTYFDEMDDEVAACWCPANPPPPGYGPPPPGTFMYYRCFCSDPGALRDRPTQ